MYLHLVNYIMFIHNHHSTIHKHFEYIYYKLILMLFNYIQLQEYKMYHYNNINHLLLHNHLLIHIEFKLIYYILVMKKYCYIYSNSSHNIIYFIMDKSNYLKKRDLSMIQNLHIYSHSNSIYF
jgi:hypothetical protein